MRTKFLPTSIIAICGVLILGSANAERGQTVNRGQPVKNDDCYDKCKYLALICAKKCDNARKCMNTCNKSWTECDAECDKQNNDRE